MTFSIAGRCPETGQLGIAVSSSSIAVASRCMFTRSAVGAALTQNITDPSLGSRLLSVCESAKSAKAAMEQIVAEARNIEWRQLALIDTRGETACFSGLHTLGVHAMAQGIDSIAVGNLLANDSVPSAMVSEFEIQRGNLADRLLSALRAGLAAGGEGGPIHSAGLQVASEFDWPIVDLRVDWEQSDDEAISKLSGLWAAYAPQCNAYIVRAVDPARSESYGVPGNE